MIKKVKVLIVEDSKYVQKVLSTIINDDDRMEVLGTATNPYEAVKIIKESTPDVITLDINMPKMDGITFLKKIMLQHPIPVIMVSSLLNDNIQLAIKAMEIGAVDVINKPIDLSNHLSEFEIIFKDKLLAVANAILSKQNVVLRSVKKRITDVGIGNVSMSGSSIPSEFVIAIGASTGGTSALMEIFSAINTDMPGVLVVQHMPEKFTFSFAKRLNEISNLNVKEAEDGEEIMRNTVYIAQGGKHMTVRRSNGNLYIVSKTGELVNRHIPAVDVLFDSVAKVVGNKAHAVLLTGMGKDGATGLLKIKEKGGYTIVQDESSCVVFGMPKAAINLNAEKIVLPLSHISSFIMGRCKNKF